MHVWLAVCVSDAIHFKIQRTVDPLMTDTVKDGGPAYPHTKVFENGTGRAQGGMSLRDYFAAKALQGMLAAGYEQICTFDPISGRALTQGKTLFQSAWDMSDAMLAARSTTPPQDTGELVEVLQGLRDNINAFGGYAHPSDIQGTGFNDGIEKAVDAVDAALSRAKGEQS